MSNPHVIIACLDTVRKDVYDQFNDALTEYIDISFSNMRAASSWSVPSHASLLTGDLPSQNGVHAYNWEFDTISPSETWFTDFPAYDTFAVSANQYASPVFGFDTLFDACVGVSYAQRFPDGMNMKHHLSNDDNDNRYLDFIKTALAHDHPIKSLANGAFLKLHTELRQLPVKLPFDYAATAINRTIRRRLARAEEPNIVFANFMDAHGPHSPFRGLDERLYDCPASYHSNQFSDWDVNLADGLGDYEDDVKAVRGLYQAEVEYLARKMAALYETVSEAVDRDVVMVITSDHGENLGYENEGYLVNHVSSLSEALLHVPFDIILPDSAAPRDQITIDGLASHLDLGEIINTAVTAVQDSEQSTADDYSAVTHDVVVAERIAYGLPLPDGADEDYWDRSQQVVYPDTKTKYYRDELGETAVYDVGGMPSKQTKTEASLPDGAFDAAPPLEDVVAEKDDDAEDINDVSDSTKSRLEELGYL